jgi:hypothetical protein
MNTQLLCLFTTKGQIDKSLDFILTNYILQNNNIFVLQSKTNDDELYITFNVEKGSAPIDSEWKTILVHRKKQSNTIYTINALNEVIKSKTGGQIDTSFQIDWNDFTNCILTTSNTGYRMRSTKVFKTINTQNL